MAIRRLSLLFALSASVAARVPLPHRAIARRGGSAPVAVDAEAANESAANLTAADVDAATSPAPAPAKPARKLRNMRKLGRRRPNLLVPVAGIITTAGGLALAVVSRRRASEPLTSTTAAPVSSAAPMSIEALLEGDDSDLPEQPKNFLDDYEYSDLKWYSKSSRKLALSKLKEQVKDWSLGPLFLIVPFGFVLGTMQFQEMLQRIMFKFKG